MMNHGIKFFFIFNAIFKQVAFYTYRNYAEDSGTIFFYFSLFGMTQWSFGLIFYLCNIDLERVEGKYPTVSDYLSRAAIYCIITVLANGI